MFFLYDLTFGLSRHLVLIGMYERYSIQCLIIPVCMLIHFVVDFRGIFQRKQSLLSAFSLSVQPEEFAFISIGSLPRWPMYYVRNWLLTLSEHNFQGKSCIFISVSYLILWSIFLFWNTPVEIKCLYFNFHLCDLVMLKCALFYDLKIELDDRSIKCAFWLPCFKKWNIFT